MSPAPAPRRARALSLSIAAVLATALPPAALADEAADPATGRAADHDIQEVVVTASALGESPLDVAQPVTVLAGEELQRSLGSSLGETLSGTLGVTGSYFGPAASRPVIRGQSGERVLMLEDGADALDVSALSADHAVSIEGIAADQVEVIKGPATLLYGNGAVGGLVNVVTHRVPTRAAGGLSGAAELRGDTALGERTAALRLDAGAGPLAFHFDGFKRKTDNVHIPGYALSRAARAALAAEGQADDTRGRLPNSASDSQGAAAGVSWIGEQGFIGVAVSRYETTYGIPGPAEEAPAPADATLGAPPALAAVLAEDGPAIDMVQTRYDLRGEWRPEGSFITAVKLRGGYNDYAHAELEPDGGVGTQFTQDAWELRLAADHAFGAFRGTVGAQVRDVDFVADGAEAFIPPSVTRNRGVFLFEELPLDAVTFEFGTRLERQEIDAGGAAGSPFPRASRDGTATGFALGAVWKLREDLQLSAHATRTQRLPGATELYANGAHLAVRRFEIGDDTLGKETARTLDIALHGTADDGPQWQVGVFIDDFQDYLYLQPTGATADGLGVFEYRQQDALFHGLEAELRLPVGVPSADGRGELRLAVDLVRGRLSDGGGDLPTVPPLRLSAEYGANWGPWSAHVELQWTDRQDRVATFETVTPDGLALSADLSWDGTLFGLDSQVFLRGGNLLDQDLRRHTSALKDYAPLPGRGVTAGLRVKF